VQSVGLLQELDRVHAGQVQVGRDDRDVVAVPSQMLQRLQPVGGNAVGHHLVVGAEPANQRRYEDVTNLHITVTDKQDRSTGRRCRAGTVRRVHFQLPPSARSPAGGRAHLLPGSGPR